MDYADIPKYLKRYSFDEKVKACFEMSSFGMETDGTINSMGNRGYPLPWEVETFLLLSIYATPEYGSQSFSGKGQRRLFEMMECIRGYVPAVIEDAKGTPSLFTKVLCTSGLTQFDVQEIPYIKYYRYSYFFGFINESVDVPSRFLAKFNAEYQDFILFAMSLVVLVGQHKPIPSKIVGVLSEILFPKVYHSLTISLQEYKKQLYDISDDPRNFTLCLRPSYTFPFIESDSKIYFPLPHLLVRATTASLLYRLTDGNNQLREIIGKEVLENYLYKILVESQCYEECHLEKEYEREHHLKGKTEDVIARCEDDVIFFDSKAAVPAAALRLLNDEFIEKDVDMRAKNIAQMYRNLRVWFCKYPTYSPFFKEVKKEKENLWGVVVVLESSYVQRKRYYERAAELLEIELDSEEYTWLTTHIKVFDLYVVEQYALSKMSIVEGLKQQIKKGTAYDITLPSEKGFEIKSDDYFAFTKKIEDGLLTVVKRLQANGVL